MKNDDDELIVRIDERVCYIKESVGKIETSMTTTRKRLTRLEIAFAGLVGYLGLNYVAVL